MKKDNWDSGKKSVGKISDQHVQPQDERKAVQKRTFTKWMNVFLQRCDPPLEVHDLFTDIQDGRILMALLEELSGCKLLYRFRSPTHRIFRLNNISKALAFLDDRHVKLLGIDASSIADGIPSVVLNLVWNIILYFQVKEVTGGLQRHLSSSLSSLSMSSYPSSSDLSPQPNDIGSYSCYTLPSKGRKAARESKYHGKAIKTLLQWVQRCTSKFGVEVHDFGKSWRSGLAFLAMIKSINPDLVKLRASLSREPRANIEQAFAIAQQSLDIPPLLEPEDVTCTSPDEQSIITYVSMFLEQCPDINQDYSTDVEVRESPKFGSLDSLTLGETTAYEPQAQASLKGLEKSEWKHWSQASSESPCTASFPMNGADTYDLFSGNDDVFSPCYSITEQSASGPAFSPFNKNKGRNRSALQPPSLLDGGVAAQKSHLRMDQGYKRQKVDDLSLSSEEEIYSLSTLDSDEEDAYSYILDLNKEVFLSHNQLKRQVPRVEEETADELNEESNHPESCEMPNGSGCKQQEGSPARNAVIDPDAEVKSHSVVHRKSALDKKQSTIGDVSNTGAAFDTDPDDESSRREPPEEEKNVRGQGNGDYSEEEKTAHVRVVTRGYDETAARVDEAEKTMLWKMSRWQKEAEEHSKNGLSLKCLQVNEKIGLDDKEEMCLTCDEGKNGKLDQKEENVNDNGNEEDREDWESVQIDSFGGGVNDTVDESMHEVRSTRATTINKKGGEDEAWSTEDLPKISKDEKKEKHASDARNSEGLEAAVAAAKKDSELKTRKCKFTDSKATTADHPAEAALKRDTGAGVNIDEGDSGWIPVYKTPHSFSEGRLLQSPAALCDITPLELEMLLVFWILLYCCLILSQMNL